jgi:DNA-binding transcriptional LysR family regulator
MDNGLKLSNEGGMVSLEWYRSFVAVYRVGTVSGAAKGLHLTQPAVSQHVAALESALGTPLFERLPRKMLPTEAGKQLYNQVVGAIELLEAVPEKREIQGAGQLIRLGAPADFLSDYLLKRWAEKAIADTSLKVHFGLAVELIEQLSAGVIEGAIATQKITQPDIAYQRICTESFWLIGPPHAKIPFSPDSIRADPTALSQWLQGQPWIAYSEELPIIRRFWRVVFGQRRAINPQFVIPDLRAIRAAVAHGLGYSVLPDYLCADWIEQHRIQLVLQPSPAVTNSLWLAYRKTERQSQPVKQLRAWLNPEPLPIQ